MFRDGSTHKFLPSLKFSKYFLEKLAKNLFWTQISVKTFFFENRAPSLKILYGWLNLVQKIRKSYGGKYENFCHCRTDVLKKWLALDSSRFMCNAHVLINWTARRSWLHKTRADTKSVKTLKWASKNAEYTCILGIFLRQLLWGCGAAYAPSISQPQLPSNIDWSVTCVSS